MGRVESCIVRILTGGGKVVGIRVLGPVASTGYLEKSSLPGRGFAMTAQPVPRLTQEEYLAIKRASETRHEFYRGEMFAMSSASHEHNTISGNLVYLLKGALRDGPCDVLASDMRVQVSLSGLYTYPDLAVICGKAQFADEHVDTLLNPKLLIEVLSSTTKSYDRGKKFEHYRQLASLQEYLLVSQGEPHIDRFVKQVDGRWALDDAHGLDGVLKLESIAAELPLVEVYRRVKFENPKSADQPK